MYLDFTVKASFLSFLLTTFYADQVIYLMVNGLRAVNNHLVPYC